MAESKLDEAGVAGGGCVRDEGWACGEAKGLDPPDTGICGIFPSWSFESGRNGSGASSCGCCDCGGSCCC